MKTIKVPEELLDPIDQLFKYYNDDIEIEDKEYCTFTDRGGAYDGKFNLYILEDKALRKIEVEKEEVNRYGRFYWFNNHGSCVVESKNDEVGVCNCKTLDQYVDWYAGPDDEHLHPFNPDALMPCQDNDLKEICVPQEYLNQFDEFHEGDAEIKINGERFFTLSDRCGAFGEKNTIYILEDKILKEIKIDEICKNRYGIFYWFDHHTQAVVKNENGDSEIFECNSLADYVEKYRNNECFNY